jgi:hypothetical protein
MTRRKINLLLLLTILISSCKGEEVYPIYEIDSIYALQHDLSFKECLRFSYIMFLKDEKIRLPSREDVYSDVPYSKSRGSLIIENAESCIFNGRYEIETNGMKMRLSSNEIVINCTEIKFDENGLLKFSFFEAALDSTYLLREVCNTKHLLCY